MPRQKSIIIPNGRTDLPVEEVGGKGLGLLRLLRAHADGEILLDHFDSRFAVPPFFIVPPGADLSNQGPIIAAARDLGTATFAVRSSYHLEDVDTEHSFDGIFETRLNVPAGQLLDAIRTVRASAISEVSTRYTSEIGIELEDRMPVIVQAMVADPDYTGVIYSKFPSPYNITKSIIRPLHSDTDEIDAFRREESGGIPLLQFPRLISSSTFGDTYSPMRIPWLHENILTLEVYFGHPIIVEFAVEMYEKGADGRRYRSLDTKSTISLLQARRLTRADSNDRFEMPELNEIGLLGQTLVTSGTGDVTKIAYVHRSPKSDTEEDIRDFDARHEEGYILFCPFLQFYHTEIDSRTPNKSAVVAFTSAGRYHDLELAGTRGILYLGFGDSLHANNTDFGLSDSFLERKPQVRTGDTVRVVSDGVNGYVYNLSEYRELE
jgi:hypothetical protein